MTQAAEAGKPLLEHPVYAFNRIRIDALGFSPAPQFALRKGYPDSRIQRIITPGSETGIVVPHIYLADETELIRQLFLADSIQTHLRYLREAALTGEVLSPEDLVPKFGESQHRKPQTIFSPQLPEDPRFLVGMEPTEKNPDKRATLSLIKIGEDKASLQSWRELTLPIVTIYVQSA